MIKKLDDNMVLPCILLMHKLVSENNNYEEYARNERSWTQHLCEHINKHYDNPRYLAIGDFTEAGELKGFMLASAFVNYYSEEWVMDVKDCIVNTDNQNVFTVSRLFDYMINHVKQHGGSLWRADSIRVGNKAKEYIEFLQKKYNATPFYGVHGRIQ